LDAKRLDEARSALRRALDLDPTYQYAAFTLIESLLASNAYTEADQVMQIVLPHRHEGWPLALAIQVCAQRRDSASARALLQELCMLPGDHNDSLSHAAHHLDAAGMTADVKAACEAAIGLGTTQEEAGALWANAAAQMGLWPEAGRVASLTAPDSVKGRALSAWITAMEQTNRREELRKLVEHNKPWARRSTPGWSAIAHGMLTLREYGEAVRWTDDWRVREEVRPWALLSRSLALRYLGKSTDAHEASRAALNLEADQSIGPHALWLKIDAGLAGDRAQADHYSSFLQGTEAESLPEFYRFLLWVSAAMDAIPDRSSPAADRGGQFALARERLGHARQARPQYRKHRLLNSVYRRAVFRIARTSGAPWAYLWLVFQYVIS
jgi:tetratricopeptide (TPR) repeat protein